MYDGFEHNHSVHEQIIMIVMLYDVHFIIGNNM